MHDSLRKEYGGPGSFYYDYAVYRVLISHLREKYMHAKTQEERDEVVYYFCVKYYDWGAEPSAVHPCYKCRQAFRDRFGCTFFEQAPIHIDKTAMPHFYNGDYPFEERCPHYTKMGRK